MLATPARPADLPVPATFKQRFGVWQTNPIAYWNQSNKSSSSPRSRENLTPKSGKRTPK
jgi:hypothetical protein